MNTSHGDTSTLHQRVVFTAYWTDASPSTEVFYFHNQALQLSVSTVSELQSELLTLMQTWHGSRIHSLVFITFTSIVMTADDVMEAGWHVITQSNAIAPTM
jgi:hypothetical protein